MRSVCFLLFLFRLIAHYCQACLALIAVDTSQAIDGYQKALDMMDEALAIEADDNEKIINMQKKIQRAK